MISFLYLLLLSYSCISRVRAQAKYTSFPSPAIPLSVKTPYLNTWLQYANGTGPGRLIPQFWEGRNVGYEGLIRIDGKTYQWMGLGIAEFPSASTITQYISPTKTVLVMMAGPIQMNVTWLSPIEPDDWAKQSFPFTYFYIDIETADGDEHNVQLYTHVTGEWVATDVGTPVKWNTTETDAVVYHGVQLKSLQRMKEVGKTEMAGDVTVYLATQKTSNLTWQSGADSDVSQTSFDNDGKLDNSMNTTFRGTNAGNPALSFSCDLSTIKATTSPIAWALGAVRDPVISYRVGFSEQPRSAAYWSKTSSIGDSITAFLSDFPGSISRSDDLDNKIMSDGLAISPEYADILALCLRQVMASMEITISHDGNGNWNEKDVKTFMKDMGTSSRVNAVDHLYAAFPAILYLNASLAGTILSPLLDLQSGLNAYSAVGDIGTTYPFAWGNITSEPSQAITNNGDMLYMLAAHAKKSGDTSLVSRYYDMLKIWADFLVTASLHTGTTYITPNELNYPDMSNLALQGIVGIHAMSAIAEMLGNKGDMEIYSRNASSKLSQWQDLAFQENHLITAYQTPTSWSVMYNLYSAKMLGLEVDQQILDSQSRFYELQATDAPAFGFSYTSEAHLVRSYWLLIASATTTSPGARDIFIKQVHGRFFWNGTTDFPCPSTYNKDTGESNGFPGGRSGLTLGASFSHLALNIPDKIIISSTNSTTTTISPSQGPSRTDASKKTDVGAVVGGVLGALFGLFVLLSGAFIFYKRRKPRKVEFRQSLLLRGDPYPGRIRPLDNTDSNIIYNPMQTQHPKPSNEKSKFRNANAAPVSPMTPDEAQMSSVWSGTLPTGAGTTTVLRNEVELMRQELAEIRANAAVDSSWISPDHKVDDMSRKR